jgi:hypothetical protein
MPVGRGACSVPRNHSGFTFGHDDPAEIAATFREAHIVDNANALGAHHVPNKGNTNEPGFDFRNPQALATSAPCDPHGRPAGVAHKDKYWIGNTNQMSVYAAKNEQTTTWLEPAIHTSNRSTCNQECFDWHEHTERGEAKSPSKALHDQPINSAYVPPEKCHDVHDMKVGLEELTNEECEPRHQRIRITPTFQSSAFSTDPLPHRDRTSNTFESHILGGDAVNNPTNWKQGEHTRRKWLAPADHMGDMILGSGNPNIY